MSPRVGTVTLDSPLAGKKPLIDTLEEEACDQTDPSACNRTSGFILTPVRVTQWISWYY